MNIRPIRTPEGGLRYEAYVAPQRGEIRELMAADRRPKPAPRSTWRRPRLSWGETLVALVCAIVTILPAVYIVGICLMWGK